MGVYNMYEQETIIILNKRDGLQYYHLFYI